ncbi:NADP-dependent oxidoreductase [Jiangella mangrovi]|uniref:NADPH:quinone reductase-like Zn-dependent oxidoreductase n=1 Tax=Jiangella mangrovi TaxID=1524084 RepID=A0A7W9LNH2_9ACTN|nr:NADP-dependent oxidoreductase [Jiangella mangrovi]MBB5790315.1 NADPH:quinone reductase-like Zn-dependent oxidoreductase [Jiangella mangrovi]
MIGLGVRAPDGELELLELPDPRQPGAGELVLEVLAAGIGPWDALLHTGGWDVGLAPPAALGVEAIGRVTATGPDETQFRHGDLVLVHEAPLPGGSGTWAEHVLVRSGHAARLPENLAPAMAAALPVAGLTAQQALDELQVDAGTRLLVVGASGPTASLAVQLARLRGADVVAGAGPVHADQLRALGVSEVIDTHVEGWAQKTGRRFDAVLIAATGTAEDAMGLLTDGGRLCSITSDAPDPVRGITTSDLYVQPDGTALGELAARAAAGELRLDIKTTPVKDGVTIANQVASGRSGGIKHVLQF